MPRKPNIGSGDDGYTDLAFGTSEDRVLKNDPRIEASGAVDHLISIIGIAKTHSNSTELKGSLEKIQDHLFRVTVHIACVDSKKTSQTLPKLDADLIKFLEEEIDKYERDLPELQNFILPGGTPLGAFLHLARTQARIVEIKLVSWQTKAEFNPYIIKYLNRLSDVFFTLARWANQKEEKSEDKWVGRSKKDI